MSLHTITKGLDLPITGEPEQTVSLAGQPRRVAIIAADYVGMKPLMHVALDDAVKRGQLLFEDRKTPGVRFTSPGAGKVSAINRGAKRALQSVVIDLNENERAGTPGPDDEVSFESYTGKPIEALSSEEIRALLLESGLWTAFRTRPFSKTPAPDSAPKAIFVTAMDTNPLAPSVDEIVRGRKKEIEDGLMCLVKLTEGKVYLCRAPGSAVTCSPHNGVAVEEFAGPHPAGNAGVHIHFLDPVHQEKTVWHIGYQDVIALGTLIQTGKLEVERTVSLAGPLVKKPRLLKTRLGASTDDLTEGELAEGEYRVISGSVLSGRGAQGDIHGYLGRYHSQISVIEEGRGREFFGWLAPGLNKFSVVRAFASCLFKGKRFALTSSTNGGRRSMVPIGLYENVMPMDIMPTFLLRSLLMNDLERAEQLGCLELDEEDLALCTFVCPCKLNYGAALRENLTVIEKEG